MNYLVIVAFSCYCWRKSFAYLILKITNLLWLCWANVSKPMQFKWGNWRYLYSCKLNPYLRWSLIKAGMFLYFLIIHQWIYLLFLIWLCFVIYYYVHLAYTHKILVLISMERMLLFFTLFWSTSMDKLCNALFMINLSFVVGIVKWFFFDDLWVWTNFVKNVLSAEMGGHSRKYLEQQTVLERT